MTIPAFDISVQYCSEALLIFKGKSKLWELEKEEVKGCLLDDIFIISLGSIHTMRSNTNANLEEQQPSVPKSMLFLYNNNPLGNIIKKPHFFSYKI